MNSSVEDEILNQLCEVSNAHPTPAGYCVAPHWQHREKIALHQGDHSHRVHSTSKSATCIVETHQIHKDLAGFRAWNPLKDTSPHCYGGNAQL